jgi:hypothetical protein
VILKDQNEKRENLYIYNFLLILQFLIVIIYKLLYLYIYIYYEGTNILLKYYYNYLKQVNKL